jgi:diguanylate cyclase (GGDEF)-like protein/PAS domain S-box-containing protein
MKKGDKTGPEAAKLKSQIASLEELLKVLEQASLEQAQSLEFRNIILVTQQETSIDGILIVDENGVVISHNRQFADMWGLTSERILSRNHVEALRTVLNKLGDPEVFIARLQYLYEHREEKGRDEIALKDGRLFDRYTSPMVGPDGTYYGRVWYLRDVTEHVLANRSLKESEEKFRAITDAAPDAVILVDNEGKVLFWNIAAERIFGYSSGEAVGKSIHELIIPPRFRAEHLQGFQNFGTTGHGHLIGKTIEVPALRKDGTELPIELSLSAVKLNDRWCATSIARDVTERKMADEKLRKLSVAVEGSSDWVLVTNKDGGIEYANRAVEEMSGYEKEELLGRTPRIFKSGRHDELFYKELWATILSGRTFRGIISNRKKDGGLFEIFHTITPLKDGDGNITHFISMAKDVTQQKILEEKIHRLAYYDDLTGLPNRVFHKELMARTIEIAKRNKQIFALLYMDLDNFKRINDTLGLNVGDLLLKSVARKLSAFLRSCDYVARCREVDIDDVLSRPGGDEFLVLLHNLGEAQDAAKVARRLLEELSAPWDLDGREVFLTASIGICLYPDDGETVDHLLKNADAAMYHAKAEGKNNYQFYSKSLNASVLELLTLESEMRKALDRGEFTLYYQPKLDASTRRITGMEALIRWNHPEKGLLLPGRFISAAETSGLIVPMAEYSLRAACVQLKRWQDEGFQSITAAVNVSGRQFDQKNLIEVVDGALRDAGLSPRSLELEITESTIMRNPDEAVRTLLALKERGIEIAIDDFGTGYSSLSYLKRLPLDFLKIDQSFVRNLASSRSDQAIVRATIAMAHSLNLKVIAEGVETTEQMAFLCDHGCDEVQGFLFSRAVPPREFEELMARVQL